MLWVQIVAIFLGVIMLAAISYVTLSIESSPFEGMRKYINPVLAWGWLLAALLANMIWALPQYALAYAAITENLIPGVIANTDSNQTKFVLSFLIFALICGINVAYSGRRGARVYEGILKILVGVIVLAFIGVVVRLTAEGALPWKDIFLGFIPNINHLTQPAGEFNNVLTAIPNETVRGYWTVQIIDTQRSIMIAAAASAVGINMTFLMPFILLGRKWNRSFRGFAICDLCIALIIPFVLVTGCIVIAAASQFHTKTWEGVSFAESGTPTLVEGYSESTFEDLQKALATRTEVYPEIPSGIEEARIASMLLPRTNRELAASLQGLFGSSVMSQKVFGLGVLAMALTTISILMLVTEFALKEAFRNTRISEAHKFGMILAATGVLWPVLWSGSSKAYLAITVGTFGYSLLPLALFSFIFMMNSKRLLGDQMPRGRSRVIWNTLMGIALVVSGSASIWTAWHVDLFGFPIGKIFILVLMTAIVSGHLRLHSKLNKQDNL